MCVLWKCVLVVYMYIFFVKLFGCVCVHVCACVIVLALCKTFLESNRNSFSWLLHVRVLYRRGRC